MDSEIIKHVKMQLNHLTKTYVPMRDSTNSYSFILMGFHIDKWKTYLRD